MYLFTEIIISSFKKFYPCNRCFTSKQVLKNNFPCPKLEHKKYFLGLFMKQIEKLHFSLAIPCIHSLIVGQDELTTVASFTPSQEKRSFTTTTWTRPQKKCYLVLWMWNYNIKIRRTRVSINWPTHPEEPYFICVLIIKSFMNCLFLFMRLLI